MKTWSGERLETSVDAETTLEHLHRYCLAKTICDSKSVLDIACGEGYGSNLLANIAKHVVGVDISHDVVAQAAQKYKKGNLEFKEGSASAIPCPDAQFDVVVSFETIEHHDEHEKMLSEIKRVLKPGGILLMSSPDKLYYSDKKNFKNKFHVKELYEDEFKDLLKRSFANTAFYLQRPTYVSLVIPEQTQPGFTEYEGNFTRVQERREFAQLYIIGIASDKELPRFTTSIFSDDDFLPRQAQTIMKKIRGTITFRLGNILLAPLKFLRSK